MSQQASTSIALQQPSPTVLTDEQEFNHPLRRRNDSSRTETDIPNIVGGRLSRKDLGLAVLRKALADDCCNQGRHKRRGRSNDADFE